MLRLPSQAGKQLRQFRESISLLSGRNGAHQRATLAADTSKRKQASRTPNAAARFGCSFKHRGSEMDRDVMMREAFGVREACFRFAMKPLKLSDEPYVRRGSSPPKNEMLSFSPRARSED